MKEGFSAFPYTHGEVIEAIRAQAKEEMQADLRQRQAQFESFERQRLGSTNYELLYGDQ